MKRTVTLIVCLLLAIAMLTACGKKPVELPEEAKFLIGDWTGEAYLNEVWTFNEDGSGRNENDLWPYDFDFTYADGVLEVYSYFGSTKSDTPTTYKVTVNSDSEIVLNDEEGGFEYILTR